MMISIIVLLLCTATSSTTTSTTLTNLHTLLDASDASQQRLIHIDGAHVSTNYIRHLIQQNKINKKNVHQLKTISLLEINKQQQQLRDQDGWKNMLAGVGHKGMAIPYYNGYAW